MNPNPPARILQANGIFCMVSGIILITFNLHIETLLGIDHATGLFIAVGILLMLYGGFLYIVMTRPAFNRPVAYLAQIGDITWVLGTIIVLALDLFDLSNAGRWAVLLVGDVVATFAIAQFIYLRRH